MLWGDETREKRAELLSGMIFAALQYGTFLLLVFQISQCLVMSAYCFGGGRTREHITPWIKGGHTVDEKTGSCITSKIREKQVKSGAASGPSLVLRMGSQPAAHIPK